MNVVSIVDTTVQFAFLSDVVDTDTKCLFLSVTLRILKERLRGLVISPLKLRTIVLIANRGPWRWPRSYYLLTHGLGIRSFAITHEKHSDDRQNHDTLEGDSRVSCTVVDIAGQDSHHSFFLAAGVVAQRNRHLHEDGWRMCHKTSRHRKESWRGHSYLE